MGKLPAEVEFIVPFSWKACSQRLKRLEYSKNSFSWMRRETLKVSFIELGMNRVQFILDKRSGPASWEGSGKFTGYLKELNENSTEVTIETKNLGSDWLIKAVKEALGVADEAEADSDN